MALTPQQLKAGINAGDPNLKRRLAELMNMQGNFNFVQPGQNPAFIGATTDPSGARTQPFVDALKTQINTPGSAANTRLGQIIEAGQFAGVQPGQAPTPEQVQIAKDYDAAQQVPRNPVWDKAIGEQAKIPGTPANIRLGEIIKAGQAAGLTPGETPTFEDVETAEEFDARREFMEFPTTTPQGQPLTGLEGATQAINQGTTVGTELLRQAVEEGRGDVKGAVDTGRTDITGAIDTGREPLVDFIDPGTRANELQAALSGALGPEAQAAAFENYKNSPGFQYLLDQSERAILANAAATGGTRGGNVLRALQENAIGLAAQDFQNMFDRLSTPAGRGLEAAGAAGALSQAQAGLLSDLGQFGGRTLSDLAATQGTTEAGVLERAGTNLAELRTQAGRDIAGQVQDIGSALADLAAAQSRDLGTVMGEGQASIEQLLVDAGIADADTRTALARLLSNLATTEGTTVADIFADIGAARGEGITGEAEGLRAGLERLANLL